MPRLLYEYLYVNMGILFILSIMWAYDHDISIYDGCILIVISLIGMASFAKKQRPAPGSVKWRKLF